MGLKIVINVVTHTINLSTTTVKIFIEFVYIVVMKQLTRSFTSIGMTIQKTFLLNGSIMIQ